MALKAAAPKERAATSRVRNKFVVIITIVAFEAIEKAGATGAAIATSFLLHEEWPLLGL